MQQNTQISREKWEVQYVHSEVIGKSVWGEFREERQRDLTTGPCRGRRMQPQSQAPDPSPQAALCAEASASAAGKAGRSRRRDRPCVGWSRDGAGRGCAALQGQAGRGCAALQGQAWGSCAGKEAVGRSQGDHFCSIEIRKGGTWKVE